MVEMARTKSKGIEDKFVDLMDINYEDSITLWGRPGTGKTTIAGTAPKPLLLIDVMDKGVKSARSSSQERGEVTTVLIEDFDELYEVYDYIKDNLSKFKSVVIDHLTSVQGLSHEKVMRDNGKNRMSQQLYGFSGGIQKEIIDLFLSLADEGIQPIFLAQDRTRGGDEEGEGEQLDPEVGPHLQPAVAKHVMAKSRIVGHTFINEEVDPKTLEKTFEYCVRLGPHPYYQTKVTGPKESVVPQYIVNPTIQDILDVANNQTKPVRKTRKRRRK